MRQKFSSVVFDKKDLGTNLKKVRDQLSKLSFTHPITVIALQQGIGKTQAFINYANKNPKEKIIFASPRHDHLAEIEKKLGDKARHWYGFTYRDRLGRYRGCPKLNSKSNPLLDELKRKEDYKNLLNPNFICDIMKCDKNKCSYHKMYEKSEKIDLIPMEYLGTKIMLNQSPDIVFIDEEIGKIEKYKFDHDLLSRCEKIAQKYSYKRLAKSIRFLNLSNICSQSKEKIRNQAMILEKWKNRLIMKCIKAKKYDDASLLYNLQSVINYLIYAPNYNKNFYYHPKIYDVFDIAYRYKRKVVFLNASFNEKLFKYFLETYPHIGVKNVTIPVYKSNVTNQRSILIRLYPNNNFWKQAFEPRNKEKTLRKVYEALNAVEKYIPREKIGIITYQNIPDSEQSLDDEFRMKGYDALHFWAESGLNIMEKKYVLFIIGTPSISTEDILRSWEEIFDDRAGVSADEIGWRGKEITLNENGNLKIIKSGKYDVVDHYTVYPIHKEVIIEITYKTIVGILRKMGIKGNFEKIFNAIEGLFPPETFDFSLIKYKSLYQLIDSIHRCRPLTHDRIIVALGSIPEVEILYRLKDIAPPENKKTNIHPLIGIQYKNAKSLRDLEREIKNHSIVNLNKVREFFEYVLDNGTYLSNSSIARIYSLWNKQKNPDASFIKEIKKLIEKIEQKIIQ